MIDISASLADLGLVQADSFKQTAFVVRDIEASAAAFWDEFRIGPWTGWTLTRVGADSRHRGPPVSSEFSACTRTGRDGATIRYRAATGYATACSSSLCSNNKAEDFATLGCTLQTFQQPALQMETRGFRADPGASGFGANSNSCLSFFETEPPIRTIVEMVRAPHGPRAAHFVYPTQEQRL